MLKYSLNQLNYRILCANGDVSVMVIVRPFCENITESCPCNIQGFGFSKL